MLGTLPYINLCFVTIKRRQTIATTSAFPSAFPGEIAANIRQYLLLLGLLAASHTFAIDRSPAYFELPNNLPPSLYEEILPLPVFTMTTQAIHYRAAVKSTSVAALKARLIAFDSAWQTQPLPFLILTADGEEWQCDCEGLTATEYLVSEVPIKDASDYYRSINDESYKAIMELIDYPVNTIALATVSFSEISYIYNATALSQILDHLGFELLFSEGFLNSAAPYRDSQFFVTQSRDTGTRYVVIRGTSGPLDIETSADHQLVDVAKVGQAHGGFADIARHVDEVLSKVFSLDEQAWIVTGHSLGGSVSILLTERWRRRGIHAQSFNYAPAPTVDSKFLNYSKGVHDDAIHNYFLPNEELKVESNIDTEHWLYVPGALHTLPAVGTTAGAAHFVINYLKSQLITHNFSKTSYEDSMPNCVLIKYACFTDNTDGYIPACAMTEDECMHQALPYLVGYLQRPNTLVLNRLIESNIYALLLAGDTTRREIILERLAHLYFLANDREQAINYLALSDRIRLKTNAGGFAGLNRHRLAAQH
jgi:hypothetical protein